MTTCSLYETANDTEVLPLRLHPMCFDTSAGNGLAPVSNAQAFSVLTSSRKACDHIDELGENELARQVSTKPNAVVVQLCSGEIILRKEMSFRSRGREVKIPLLFSEVSLAYDPFSRCEVIVLTDPFLEQPLASLKRNSSVDVCKLWVFCVKPDTIPTSQLVECFGSHGAIRFDVASDITLLGMEPIDATSRLYMVPPSFRPIVSSASASVPELCVKFSTSMLWDIQREVAMLVAARGHPNILRFYSIFSFGSPDASLDVPSVPFLRSTSDGVASVGSASTTYSARSRRASLHKDVVRESEISMCSFVSEPVRPRRRSSFNQKEVESECSVNTSGSEPLRRFGMVTDFYGRTLVDVVAKCPLPEEQLVGFARDLVGALKHLQGVGVVHCNVCPENVQMTPSGQPILSGFDCAVRTAQPRHRRGSPEITAPELILDAKAPVGPPTDMFALGVVMYYVALGQPPFRASNISKLYKAILRGKVDFQQNDMKKFSLEYQSVLQGLLAVSVQDRWGADDVLISRWFCSQCSKPREPKSISGSVLRFRTYLTGKTSWSKTSPPSRPQPLEASKDPSFVADSLTDDSTALLKACSSKDGDSCLACETDIAKTCIGIQRPSPEQPRPSISFRKSKDQRLVPASDCLDFANSCLVQPQSSS